MKHSPLYESILLDEAARSVYDQALRPDGQESPALPHVLPLADTESPAAQFLGVVEQYRLEQFYKSGAAEAYDGQFPSCERKAPTVLDDVRGPGMANLVRPNTFEAYQRTMHEMVFQSKAENGLHQYIDPFEQNTNLNRTVGWLLLCMSGEFGIPDDPWTMRPKGEQTGVPLTDSLFQFVRSVAMATNVNNVRRDLGAMQERGSYRQKHMATVLQQQYPVLSRREAKALVRDNVDLPVLSFALIAKELRQIYKTEGLAERKWTLRCIAGAQFISGAMFGLIAQELRRALGTNQVQVPPLMERVGLTIGAGVLGGEVAERLESHLYSTSSYWNGRFVRRLFARTKAKLDKSVAYITLRDGKQGTADLWRSASKCVAALGTIGVAGATVIDMNPWLGLGTLAGLPLTYLWSKHHNAASAGELDTFRTIDVDSAQSVDGVLESQDDLSLYDRDRIGEELRATLDQNDAQSYQVRGGRERRNAMDMLPSAALATIAAVGGVALLGVEHQGEVASYIYSSLMLLTSAADMARKLHEMGEALHKRHSLSRLLGEDHQEEQGRVGVSSLPNLGMQVRKVDVIAPRAANRSVGRDSERQILREVSFTIPPGTLAAIRGESAGGKSTLLKVLSGTLAPTRGDVVIGADGSTGNKGVPLQDIRLYGHDSWGSQVACVLQHPKFNPKATLLQNLLPDKTAEELAALTPEDERAINLLLAKLNMTHFSYSLDCPMPQGLAGGESMRLALIRALLKQPKILLTDELTSPLDKKATGPAVLQLLREYLEENPDTIVVSVMHDKLIETAGLKLDQVIDLDEVDQKQAIAEQLERDRELALARRSMRNYFRWALFNYSDALAAGERSDKRVNA